MNSMSHQSIGQQIKSARTRKELSLEVLSQEVGCSSEYLDWVEKDQVEPPVALLLRLARALSLDSGVFFKAGDSKAMRLAEASKRTEHYSYTTLTPPEPDSHLMAFSVRIPPGTSHEGVGYRHDGEEFVYVISGQVDLIVDGEKHSLGVRESMRFDSARDHHLSNPGEAEADLLIVLYLP